MVPTSVGKQTHVGHNHKSQVTVEWQHTKDPRQPKYRQGGGDIGTYHLFGPFGTSQGATKPITPQNRDITTTGIKTPILRYRSPLFLAFLVQHVSCDFQLPTIPM